MTESHYFPSWIIDLYRAQTCPMKWKGFFQLVFLSSGGISRAGVSRYLMSSLHQVLARQGARNNRSYNYHLYIGWYWVISLFFTQIKQTPPLNCKLLNLATELSNFTFAAILGLSMGISYFFMSKWASFSDKKNYCSLWK